MGQSSEKITWLDDWHLLPFDGVADWRGIARRLNTVGYQDALTFELGKRAAQYGEMSIDEYLSAAYDRAKKFRKIVEEER
jgi:sugar phosphate isomerase/epimerase